MQINGILKKIRIIFILQLRYSNVNLMLSTLQKNDDFIYIT